MESNVNREIRNYHEGVFMGLSVRQTVCALLAVGLGAGANFGLRRFIGTEPASVICIFAAAIPAAIGFMTYHGLPFEQIAVAWLRTNFVHNGWYVYKSTNFYAQFTSEGQQQTKKSQRKKKKDQNDSSEVEQNEKATA